LDLVGKPAIVVSNGLLAKRRGARAGLPDVMVIFCQRPIFVEVKSRAGVASKAQKQVRVELKVAGVQWWMARSVAATLTALRRSGVRFQRPWKPPALKPWEGPFTGEEKRLPQHPAVAARQREACRRWSERQRTRKAATQAVERNNEAASA
jgi:hypothetical protein